MKNVEKMFSKPHKRNNEKRKSYVSSLYIPCVCYCEFTQNCCEHSANILQLSYYCVFKSLLHMGASCISEFAAHIPKGNFGEFCRIPAPTHHQAFFLFHCCKKSYWICILGNKGKIFSCYGSEFLFKWKSLHSCSLEDFEL